MPQALTHPFPLRLTAEERSTLDRVFEAFKSKASKTFQPRTTRADIARMALDRGLQLLLQEVAPKPSSAADVLPHDDAWMNGGALLASESLPPYEWNNVDPNRDGDPILTVPGRGAFVIQ